MDLRSQIEPKLWQAIQSTYETGNYTPAILDAMHFLSNVLRDKTGADGDGVALVGQTLGGDAPRLRINKLQTETEKNEQRGIESILRGMFQAIRNPRSHEQTADNKETADSIICFINYLVGIINKSEEPFVLSRFLLRVFDSDFYNSQNYAELLVNEIPENKRFDTLVAIYRNKFNGEIDAVGLVTRALIRKLTDRQLDDYLLIVSDELSTITDEKEIRYNLCLLPPNIWGKLSELSKLRIENRIIKSIKRGTYDYFKDSCSNGALATWAIDHIQYFSLKDQVAYTLMDKLDSKNEESVHFVINWFLLCLPKVISSEYLIKGCVLSIAKRIRESDAFVRNKLTEKINSMPDDWINEFSVTLKDMTDENNPEMYLVNGNPFLKNDNSSSSDDDIPF